MRPHNLPLVLLGATLLWFGWFGFNAGSELAVDGITGLAFMNTQVATAAAAGSWILVEKLRDGHSTTLGLASGAVSGLVAITPACGFIDPWASLVLGAIAGAASAYAVRLKYRFGYDDSLDVVGVHLVAGAIGAVALGFFAAYPAVDPQGTGLFYGGGFAQLGKQALGPVVVGLYSFVLAWVIGKIIDKTMGFRVSVEAETTGVDVTGARIGERWRIGTDGLLLEVTAPRTPCRTFAAFLGIRGWIKTFTAAGKPGAYLRVLSPGRVRAGDAITVEHRPDHDVTIGLAFRARMAEPELLPRLLVADALAEELKAYARRKLAG